MVDRHNASKGQGQDDEGDAGGEGRFTVELTLEEGYRFTVDPHLPDAGPFAIDEASPVGAGSAVTPSRALASAVASCLGASLLFCLRKARI